MTSSHVLTACRRHGDAPALESAHVQLSYREMLQEAEALAFELNGQKAVAIHLPNGPGWVIADLACMLAGVPCVPLPVFFTPEQTKHVLKDAGVSVILTHEPARFCGTATPWFAAKTSFFLVEQSFNPVDLPADTAKITYTSGTTGQPKGVCLTQQAMERVATSLSVSLGDGVIQRHCSLLPLAVLLENVAGVYTTFLAGGTCITDQPQMQPQALADHLHATRATTCILVPELLRLIIQAHTPLPHLRFAAVGGARVDPAMLTQAKALGIPVYEGYGISENASVIALNLPDNTKHGSVGKVLPHVTLKIEQEEIYIRDPLFSGYLGHPAPKDEWHATGDLGALDEEGYLFIHGRKRAVYITSYGRNVSPEWPESLLGGHPAIAQAAVFGEAKPYAVAVITPFAAHAVHQAVREVNARLPEYAQIGAYVLAHEPFSIRNHQLTGNGRPRRDAIYAAYAAVIDQCYQTEKRL